LINNGSPNWLRNRESEWLTADCVRPSRSAARLTLRHQDLEHDQQIEVEPA
jgi:hypothetical protein